MKGKCLDMGCGGKKGVIDEIYFRMADKEDAVGGENSVERRHGLFY